ncbi:MAG: Riboflavin biosynthesis protein RibF [Deltaproteobacteria bacterium ADurb.Bin510]|nr:MAG: Riboflavin biosynthesis protein RibF [Deltaproteobacteria bacterium ADurb.Bin510]
MKLFRGTEKLVSSRFKNPVVTIGNFDGCHLGHQEIFRRVKAYAARFDGEAVAYTFEPHPLSVVRGVEPQLILNLDEKIAAIQGLGLNALVVAEFTPAVASTPPRDFIREIMLERIGIKGLVVGHDFVFGRANSGDINYLRELGRELDFFVERVEPVKLEGQVVSSSLIREHLQAAEIRPANRLLGRPYGFKGTVVHGMHRGRELGFPTANLISLKPLMVPEGVYAVAVTAAGRRRQGVLNIGSNPTFGDVGVSVEVHIFDFEGDLYGAELQIDFIEFIRGEIKFADKRLLIEQMAADCEFARTVFEGAA